jgi:hypothetical protein
MLLLASVGNEAMGKKDLLRERQKQGRHARKGVVFEFRPT